MAMISKRIVLITGEPGIGKTTLVKKLHADLSALLGEAVVGGFYTEEVRQGPIRTGFDVVKLGPDSVRTELARKGRQSVCFVGAYAVFTEKFEKVALPVLEDVNNFRVLFIDEIGRMEMKSQRFMELMHFIFGAPQVPILVATVPLKSALGFKFVDNLKARKDVELFTVTKSNRENIFRLMLNHIKYELRLNP